MPSDRTLRLAAALTTVVALAGCGRTDRLKPTDKATPVAVPSIPATVNPSPSASPTPAESASESASASATPTLGSGTTGGGGTVVKATGQNKFEPATLTVKAGAKVTWQADPGTFHSANSGTPPTVDTAGPIQAPVGFPTYSVTFKKPGTYKYFCQPHASLGMTGEIVVT